MTKRLLLTALLCIGVGCVSSWAREQRFGLFLQEREKPLTATDSIPQYAHLPAGGNAFCAITGEYFTFQVGVMAYDSLSNVYVSFRNLKAKGHRCIPATAFTCFNQEGTDFRGRPFTRDVSVRSGKLQPLWIGVDLTDVQPGTYQGRLTFHADGRRQHLPFTLQVEEGELSENGCSEGWRMARMKWLNSTVGQEDELTEPFLPLERQGHTLSLLGRQVTLSEQGLPSSILSYFNASIETLSSEGQELLASPISLNVTLVDGTPAAFRTQEPRFEDSPTAIVWSGQQTSPQLKLTYQARLEYDGFMRYDVTLTARRQTDVADISLSIPMRPEKSRYWMGLGEEGGYRTSSDFDWKWDITKNQDMMWLGDINGGLRLKLMDEHYRRPLVNIYYAMGQLVEPRSWSNDGQGGVSIREQAEAVEMKAYSGHRTLAKGDTLHINFELLLTPFKLVDRSVKYGDRYAHGSSSDDSAAVDKAYARHATIMNVHHNEYHYPFINYPYQDTEVQSLDSMIRYAHERDLRVKFYYTTREITKNFSEFWAFNSLQGEVIYPGPGNASKTLLHRNGPPQWFIDNLKENYIPAWYCVVPGGIYKGVTDLSVITTPDSRLNNYYVAGLDWMLRNMQIDGVYIDDSALDRYTLRRARRLIDRYRPEGRIDFHTCNHYDPLFGLVSCAQLYMDLMPYIDLSWIGEGHSYNRSPDHWLVEYTTLPFGVPGQMLQGGGNLWRGAVFGMTNRIYGNRTNVIPIWQFWDDYDIQSKEMIGFWDERAMATVDNDQVKATLFYGPRQSILAVACWGDQDQPCTIQLDWEAMGYDPAQIRILQPAIEGFQPALDTPDLQHLVLPQGKGYLFVIEQP